MGVALEGRRDAGRSGCRGHCSRSKGRTFGSSSDGFRQLRRTLQSNRRKIEYLEGNSSQQGPASPTIFVEKTTFRRPIHAEAGADRALAPTCRDADEASQEDPDARTDSDLEVSSSDNVTVSDTLRTSVSQPRSNPGRSVLSEVRDAQRYPALNCLQEGYQDIRLFRDWAFGPSAALRRNPERSRPHRLSGRRRDNLALVLSQFLGDEKREARRGVAGAL